MVNEERTPNPTRVILWCIITWLSAVIGVALAVTAGNWVAFLYALNSAFLAAGWWLACQRWAEYKALALSALKELEIASRDGNHDGREAGH